jgi:hypothetical protein
MNAGVYVSLWIIITEEPEMLLDEKDMGEAGRRMYGSLFMLALLCIWGPPDRHELASVTSELTPTLGPAEWAVPLGTVPILFMSATGRYQASGWDFI